MGRSGKPDAAVRSLPDRMGERIRALRLQKELRLVDMAKMTDLSVSFISQVERGLTIPGMRSLILIADALEVSPHSLLDERPQSDARWVLTRAAEQVEVENDGGGRVRSIADENPSLVAYDFTGGPTEFFSYYQTSGDILLIVLAGRVEIDLEGERVTLAPGDTIYLRAGVRHMWRQVGRARMRVITVLLHDGPGAGDAPMVPVPLAGRRPPKR